MQKNPHAVALGSLGGKKRAVSLSAVERQKIASKAGSSRWEGVSKERRSLLAKRLAKARWGK
jgi:hypothetical protein